MVPTDPDKIQPAIEAALARASDRLASDLQDLRNDRTLPPDHRIAGENALAEMLRAADELKEALAASLGANEIARPEQQDHPRNQP